jgi:hypothetical protein
MSSQPVEAEGFNALRCYPQVLTHVDRTCSLPQDASQLLQFCTNYFLFLSECSLFLSERSLLLSERSLLLSECALFLPEILT